MNKKINTMAHKKEKSKNVLGNCPNCGAPLQDDLYGSIQFKDDKVDPGAISEDLVVCSTCLENFENLSPEIIGENLRTAEIEWEEKDILLAMSAVQKYKESKKS